MDWWNCRSRSPLSNPPKICKNHGRNWERGKLSKVNKGGERGGNLVLERAGSLGKKGGLFIGPQKKSRCRKLTPETPL